MSGTWKLLAAGALALAIADPAAAQGYPAKPVRVIVPFPAGGGADLMARAVTQKLGAAWGQQPIVDNRAGAGGMIGSELVAKAAPDGYTLLATTSSTHSINPHLAPNRSYDPLRDFAPVALIASAPNILVVHPSVPARTVKELAALARSRPGQLNYASTGVGTLSHLTAELFKLRTGASLAHIPYKGGPPALIDVASGQVSMMFIAVPTAAPHMRSGRLRAIAVTGAKRVPTFKDVPTVAETIPEFESSQWWALFAPAGTPPELVAKVNADVNSALRDAEVRARFAAEGAEGGSGTPAEFAAFFRADYEKWGKVVRQAGIRAD